ncbi:hypothetical protein V2H29_00635 [Lysinibacillus fusiformis]|uniref:hypothetical protein n=1 Tax=Lysinibacillus TaxID=400634 RepID=UPI002EA5EAB7|nr:hypothetical protein [Lysinibacillus fusiformis]
MTRFGVQVVLENGESAGYVEVEANSPGEAYNIFMKRSTDRTVIFEPFEGQTLFIPYNKILKIAINNM